MCKSSTKRHILSCSMLVLLLVLALLPINQVSAQLWSALETVPSVGLIASESLRLCFAFPESANRSERPSQAVGVRFRVFDAEGDVLAQSEEIAVRERQTRCWDVRRTALPRVGEPGTGRLQVRAIIEIRITAPPFPHQGQPGFLPSVEIIDNNTGGTKLGPIIGTLIGNAIGGA